MALATQGTNSDQESTTPPFSPQKISLIDRYLDCSRQEQMDDHNLEVVRIRTQQLQKELGAQDKERIRLNDLKLSIGKVKRKAWNAMSKEESRELGRREYETKKQKDG